MYIQVKCQFLFVSKDYVTDTGAVSHFLIAIGSNSGNDVTCHMFYAPNMYNLSKQAASMIPMLAH